MAYRNYKHESKKRNRSRALSLTGIFLLVASQVLTAVVPLLLLFPDRIVAATTPAQAPVIKKNTAHTSLYIQSSDAYQRQVREVIQAESIDGGVLSYRWYLLTSAQKEANSANNGYWSDGEKASHSYGKQSVTSNVLDAITPTAVGIYYTYCEVTNTNSDYQTNTVKSALLKLDVRANKTGDKVAAGVTDDDISNPEIPTQIENSDFSQYRGTSMRQTTAASFPNRADLSYWDTTGFYNGHSYRNYAITTTGSGNTSITAGSGNFQIDTESTPQHSGNGYNVNNAPYLYYVNGQKNHKFVDLKVAGMLSLYQNFSSVPGKIYEWSFNNWSNDNPAVAGMDKDIVAMILSPSKFAETDYTADASLINRYYAGALSNYAGDDRFLANNSLASSVGQAVYANNAEYTKNLGSFPYGIDGIGQWEVRDGLNDVVTAGTAYSTGIGTGTSNFNSQFTTNYFADAIRSYLYNYDATSRTAYTNKQTLKADTDALRSGMNANAIASKINGDSATYRNKAKTFKYGQDTVTAFLSSDWWSQDGDDKGVAVSGATAIGTNPQINHNVVTKKGYMTIPEGQGASVLAFTALGISDNNNDDMVNDIVFKPLEKPQIKTHQTVTTNAIQVTTKEDYAYGLLDVSQGYAQRIANPTADFGGTAISPDSDGWVKPSSAGTLSFNNLEVGRSYRVVAIPVGAIQDVANHTPLDVIDPDAYKDITMPLAKNMTGTVVEKDAQQVGEIRIKNASLTSVYAILADDNGAPQTNSALKTWMNPTAEGTIVFKDLPLDPDKNQTTFWVVVKPEAFFNYDYQMAAYSVVDGGLIAVPMTIYHGPAYYALIKPEVARANKDGTTDTITVTRDNDYRNDLDPSDPSYITTFIDGQAIVFFDPVTLEVIKGFDVNNKSSASLDVPKDKDVAVALVNASTFDGANFVSGEYTESLTAYAAPEDIFVHYGVEKIGIPDSNGFYYMPATLDYHFKDQEYVQGVGIGVGISEILDQATTTTADRTVHYTKHFDHTKDVGVAKTLTFPERPVGPTVGTTGSEDVKIDYPAETLTANVANIKVRSTAEHSTLKDLTQGSAVALNNADLIGWQEIRSHDLSFVTGSTATSFQSFPSDYTLLAKGTAPIVAAASVNGTNLDLSGITVGGHVVASGDYEYQLKGTGAWSPVTVTAGATSIPGYQEDDWYYLRRKATVDAPASMRVTVQAGEVAITWIEEPRIYDDGKDIMGKITITNHGTEDATFDVNAFTLAPINPLQLAADFKIVGEPTGLETLAAGASNTYTIKCINNTTPLDAGMHDASLTFSYTQGGQAHTAYAMLKTTIAKAKWGIPSLPTKAAVEAGTGGNSVTDTSITLPILTELNKDGDGHDIPGSYKYEFRVNMTGSEWSGAEPPRTWGSSGLTPAMGYTVKLCQAPDDNHFASDPVDVTYYTRYATPTLADLHINYTNESYNLSTQDGSYDFKINEIDQLSTGSFTDLLNANNAAGFSIELKKNAHGEVPESATFETSLKRPASPTITKSDVTVYRQSFDGQLINAGSETIEYRHKGAGFYQTANGNTQANNVISGEYEVRTQATASTFASLPVEVSVDASGYRVEVDVNTDEAVTMPMGWPQSSGRVYGKTQLASEALTRANTAPDPREGGQVNAWLIRKTTKYGPEYTADLVPVGVNYTTLHTYADDDGVVRYVVNWIHVPTYTVTIPTTVSANHADETTQVNMTITAAHMADNEKQLKISTEDSLDVTLAGATLTIDTSEIFGITNKNQLIVQDVNNKTQTLTLKRANETPKYSGIYTGTLTFEIDVEDKIE
ncbi:MAG: hypothetical protein LBS41_03265 [Streptococcaceae bacterium]|jgi:hypothetical protein|nr:hypothetical protein [Streptococcaceae bacterium]